MIQIYFIKEEYIVNIQKRFILSVITIFSTVLFLTSCAKEEKLQRPQVPANTVGSFNFLNNDGKGSLVVFDKAGNRVTPEQKPLPPSAKPVFEATIKYFQVNPCYVEICSPGKPCETVLISPGACLPGF